MTYALLILLALLILFIIWFSPSLFGIIPGGIDKPSTAIQKIEFDTTSTGKFKIEYLNNENDPELIKLREMFNLDTLLIGAENDFEKIKRIQSWVHSKWIHSGGNRPEKNDAIYILQEAEKGRRFRCVEYSIVTKECLKSLGYKTRTVSLKTKDINEVKLFACHVVNEVYIPDLQKWLFLDPQIDIIATLNGIPLNAVEFQRAIINKDPIEIINPSKVMSDEGYIKWIGSYLFYFTTPLNNGSTSYWDFIIGNKRQLTLVPKGFEPPVFFQRLFRIRTECATYSEKDFYPKP